MDFAPMEPVFVEKDLLVLIALFKLVQIVASPMVNVLIILVFVILDGQILIVLFKFVNMIVDYMDIAIMEHVFVVLTLVERNVQFLFV